MNNTVIQKICFGLVWFFLLSNPKHLVYNARLLQRARTGTHSAPARAMNWRCTRLYMAPLVPERHFLGDGMNPRWAYRLKYKASVLFPHTLFLSLLLQQVSSLTYFHALVHTAQKVPGRWKGKLFTATTTCANMAAWLTPLSSSMQL